MSPIVFRCLSSEAQIAISPGLHRDFVRSVRELVGAVKLTPSKRSIEDYQAVTNRRAATVLMQYLPDVIALDLETTGLDPYMDTILTVSISHSDGKAFTIPWMTFIPEEWNAFLHGKKTITQNGQFDFKFLISHGVNSMEFFEDTMLMHSLIDETPSTHGMEFMSHKYLNTDKWVDMVDYKAFRHGLLGMPNPPGIDTSEPPSETFKTVGIYGARDAHITEQLHKTFEPELKGRFIASVLPRVQKSLIESEVRGIKINLDLAFKMQGEIADHLDNRRQMMEDRYGIKNPNSVQQVKRLLYEDIGIPAQKYKGKVTTRSEMLEPLAQTYPVIAELLEYRRLTKASGTYIKNIIEASELDGRYHPTIKLAGTETGRVTERILTLLPRSEDVANADLGQQYQARLRELFIPDDGYMMIGADYSALEVRIAALLSGDDNLISDIQNDVDIHSVNAISAFGLDIPLEPYNTLKARTNATNAHDRTLAKIATFASLYGGTAAVIAFQTGIEINKAQAIIDQLYSRYPKLRKWQERTVRHAISKGYVETPWGRRRNFQYFKGMSDKAHDDQSRAAINSPIQSHGNDLNLFAFAQITEMSYETLFPFHDAIYLQVEEDWVEETKQVTKKVMESIIDADIVFEADVKAGLNWAEL